MVSEFKKTKYDEDYTYTTRTMYKIYSELHGYTARISDIFQMLKESFGIQEFDLFDPKMCNNASIESYLIDEFIKWKDGEPVDFVEIYNALVLAGDFSASEKALFESGNIEERLWAMFLVISDPSLNI